LRKAGLRGATLGGVDLDGADLQDTKLRDAKYNENTIWPDGFDPRAAGAVYKKTPGISVQDY